MSEPDLERLRRELDAVDRRLLAAIADRLRLVHRVSLAKQRSGRRPRDEARETELLARIEDAAAERSLPPLLVRAVYRLLLDHSVRMQVEGQVDDDNPGRGGAVVRVGYQGVEGCYSSIAAAQYMAPRSTRVTYQGFEGFAPLLRAVESGDIDLALLPIENTTAGTINESYDLLAALDLHLTGEHFLAVRHCLIGLRPVPLAHIRRVRSHPMALAQCRRFLGGLSDCLVESYPDTAMACDDLLFGNDPSQAAIASEEAARMRDLVVLARDVGDRPDNTTRFVVVEREPVRCDPRLPVKTSVVMGLRHESGALYRALAALDRRGLNLTKLESRPSEEGAWLYNFYLDFEGHDGRDDALEELRGLSSSLRVLGTYPQGDRPRFDED